MTPKKAAQTLNRLGGFHATSLAEGYQAEADPAVIVASELSRLLETAYYGKDTRKSTHEAYVRLKDLIRMIGVKQ